MIRRIGFAVACCAFVYIAGYQLGFRSWNQQVSVLINPEVSARGLASVGEEDLNRSIASIDYKKYSDKQNLFKKAQVISSKDDIQFLIGNVLHNDMQGNQQFICDSFSKVRLVFEAYGIARAGERVVMQMVSSCKKNSDFSFLGPFNLPYKLIQKSPISLTDFEKNGSSFHFYNVSISWPTKWVLMRVEFSGGADQKPYVVPMDTPQSEEDIFLIDFSRS